MPTLSDDDRRRMADLTTGLASKAERIRRLAAAGFRRADIARFLGVRYQYVYNVLTAPAPARVSAQPGPAELAAAGPKPVWARIGRGGRVVIPMAFLDVLGLKEGDDVQVRIEEGAVRMLSRDLVVRQVQELVAKYVPPGVSLVDELIAERRREAAREERGD